MARTTRVVHTCDLHGDETEAATSVLVTTGKRRIELDVCQAHLDVIVGAGRKPASDSPAGRRQNGSSRSTARRTKKARTGPPTAAVREWAIENGHEVNARGRIAADVIAAYSQAHGKEAATSS